MFFFFFSSRRRHTRLTCDWSSDVCSSDLSNRPESGCQILFGFADVFADNLTQVDSIQIQVECMRNDLGGERLAQIGRASCRERVYIPGVAISLRRKRAMPSCSVTCLILIQ